MKYRCDNCGVIRERDECAEVKDPSRRFDVGGSWTDRECPDCGALCYRLPGVKLRWARRGTHVWMVVFMGEDIEHMASCGTLTLRETEFERLRNTLAKGAEEEKFEFIVEEVDSAVDLS